MKVEFIFLFMQHAIPMLTDKEGLKLYKSPQDLIMELANIFVNGISPAAD